MFLHDTGKPAFSEAEREAFRLIFPRLGKSERTGRLRRDAAGKPLSHELSIRRLALVLGGGRLSLEQGQGALELASAVVEVLVGPTWDRFDVDALVRQLAFDPRPSPALRHAAPYKSIGETQVIEDTGAAGPLHGPIDIPLGKARIEETSAHIELRAVSIRYRAEQPGKRIGGLRRCRRFVGTFRRSGPI